MEDRDIKADSFAEFRRLKRIRMWEKQTFSLWRNTPSPPPGSREEAMILQQ